MMALITGISGSSKTFKPKIVLKKTEDKKKQQFAIVDYTSNQNLLILRVHELKILQTNTKID